MNHRSRVRLPRRRPTIGTWLGFAASVLALTTVIGLTVLVASLPEPDRSAPVSAADPDLAPGLRGLGGRRVAEEPVTPEQVTGDAPAAPGQAPTTGPVSADDGRGGTGSGGAQPEPEPVLIDYFQVTQQPRCPSGTNLNPIDGQPVTLAWQVTGAAEVTLSIDGPGIYRTYPAEGSDTIPFPCEGQEGERQTHTYLLTAVGESDTETASLVVTATVGQIAQV